MTDEEYDDYYRRLKIAYPKINKTRAQLEDLQSRNMHNRLPVPTEEEKIWLEERRKEFHPPPKISAEEMEEMFGPDFDLESYVSEGKDSIDIEKTAEEKPELAAVLYSMIEVALEDEEPVCVVAMAWYEKHQTMEEDMVLDILSKPDERSGSGGSTGSGG